MLVYSATPEDAFLVLTGRIVFLFRFQSRDEATLFLAAEIEDRQYQVEWELYVSRLFLCLSHSFVPYSVCSRISCDSRSRPSCTLITIEIRAALIMIRLGVLCHAAQSLVRVSYSSLICDTIFDRKLFNTTC